MLKMEEKKGAIRNKKEKNTTKKENSKEGNVFPIENLQTFMEIAPTVSEWKYVT
jgi:hypothetical protein